MDDEQPPNDLLKVFGELMVQGRRYLRRAEKAIPDAAREEARYHGPDRDFFWSRLPAKLQAEATALIEKLVKVGGDAVVSAKTAPLASEADQRDIATGVKAMRAALLLRKFHCWDTEVLHDEGTVLGVQRAGQSDDVRCPPEEARKSFSEWAERVEGAIKLVVASRGLSAGTVELSAGTGARRYRPNTAFIMMWMDGSRVELDDVADTVKQVFANFDIRASRADDIEHEELITQRILDEISTAEFLFADLTGARPSVYYEVGYAHALRRRVILFRRSGTGLHFDLAGYNCPEYKNLRELKEKLTKRLESLTNRGPRAIAERGPRPRARPKGKGA